MRKVKKLKKGWISKEKILESKLEILRLKIY